MSGPSVERPLTSQVDPTRNGMMFAFGLGKQIVKKSKVQFDAMVLAQTVFPQETLLHRTV